LVSVAEVQLTVPPCAIVVELRLMSEPEVDTDTSATNVPVDDSIRAQVAVPAAGAFVSLVIELNVNTPADAAGALGHAKVIIARGIGVVDPVGFGLVPPQILIFPPAPPESIR
jgi:hypothetical protein